MTGVEKEAITLENKSFTGPIAFDNDREIHANFSSENNFQIKFFEKLTDENLHFKSNQNNLDEVINSDENRNEEAIYDNTELLKKENEIKNKNNILIKSKDEESNDIKNKLFAEMKILDPNDIKLINIEEEMKIDETRIIKNNKNNYNCNVYNNLNRNKKRRPKTKSRNNFKETLKSSFQSNEQDCGETPVNQKTFINPIDNFLNDYNKKNQNSNVKINILINQNKSINFFPIDKDLFLTDFSLKKPEEPEDKYKKEKQEAVNLINKINLNSLNCFDEQKNFTNKYNYIDNNNYGQIQINNNQSPEINRGNSKKIKSIDYDINIKPDNHIIEENENFKVQNKENYKYLDIKTNKEIDSKSNRQKDFSLNKNILYDQELNVPVPLNENANNFVIKENNSNNHFHTQLSYSNSTNLARSDSQVTHNVLNLTNGSTKRRTLLIVFCLIISSLLMIGIPILVIFIKLSYVNKTFSLLASGKNIYELLSSFKVECPGKQVLESFWLHKNNEGFYQYKFLCLELTDLTVKESFWVMNPFSKVDLDVKDSLNLGKQEVRCPGQAGLQGFGLIYDKIKNDFAYHYKCALYYDKNAEPGDIQGNGCEKTTTLDYPLSIDNDSFSDLTGLRVEKAGFRFLNGFKIGTKKKKSVEYIYYDVWICK